MRPGPRVERARSDGHLDINWRTHANGPPAAPLTTVLRRPRQPIRTIKNWLRLRTATAACDRGHNGAVLVPEPHRSPPPPRVNGQASNIWARVAGEGDRRSTVRNPSMLGHAITSADDDGDADLGALNKRYIVYTLYAAVIDVSGHLNSCIRTWRTEHACRQDAPNSGLGLVRATATHCAPRPDRRLHPMIRQIAHGARPHILSLHSSGKPLRDNSGHPPGVALFVLSPCASTLVAALANA